MCSRKRFAYFLGSALLLLGLSVPSQASEDPAVVSQVQTFLNASGYDCGVVDGIMGEATREAILALQRDHGVEETGVINGDVINLMMGNVITDHPAPDQEPSQEEEEEGFVLWQEDKQGEVVDMVPVTKEAPSAESAQPAESDTPAEADLPAEEDPPAPGSSSVVVSHPGPYTPEELEVMALTYYEGIKGYRPLCEYTVFENTGVVALHLYVQDGEETTTLDWYNIDPMTGTGTNMATEEVDLTKATAPVKVSAPENIIYDVSQVLHLTGEDAALALGFTYSQPWISDYGDSGMIWYPQEEGGTELFYFNGEREIPGAFSLEIEDEAYFYYGLKVGASREEILSSLEAKGHSLLDRSIQNEIYTAPLGGALSTDYIDGFCVKWYYDHEAIAQLP